MFVRLIHILHILQNWAESEQIALKSFFLYEIHIDVHSCLLFMLDWCGCLGNSLAWILNWKVYFLYLFFNTAR